MNCLYFYYFLLLFRYSLRKIVYGTGRVKFFLKSRKPAPPARQYRAPDTHTNSRKIQPRTGLEPVNLILTKDVLYLLSYLGDCTIQAGNETRTHNSHLGRVELYQLSYTRKNRRRDTRR